MDNKKDNSVEFAKMIWDEVSKINWRNVNEDSLKTFLITVVGDEITFNNFEEALETSSYELLGLEQSKKIKLSEDAKSMKRNVEIDKINDNAYVLSNSDIVIVDSKYLAEVRSKLSDFYIFNSTDHCTLYERILNDNSEIAQALCFNYPVFRTILARKIITDVSIQNALWAGGTAAVNIIPGPQQVVTGPLEAVSDFTILTGNELRMIFIICGIAGKKVNPIKLIPELAIMLSGAKGAQMVATQVTGKIPAGAGSAIKGGVAFAFTYAIGEAVFLNFNYKTKINFKEIILRIEKLKEYAKDILKKKENAC